MKEIANMISGGVMLGGLFALLAIVAGVFIVEFCRLWRLWKRNTGRYFVPLNLLALVCTYIGGTKPPAVFITWDEYFTHRSATVDTNDLRRITFDWDVAQGVPNFATATFKAVEKVWQDDPTSNGTFVIASVPMTNRTLTAYMTLDATNYIFFAECDFIPDAPVVTNGVYHVQCVGGEDVWVPIGMEIYDNGETIAPAQSYLLDLLMENKLQ